jgi:hypothetical protein
MIPGFVPAFVPVTAALVALAAWVASRFLGRKPGGAWRVAALFAGRCAIGTATIWCVFQSLGRAVQFVTPWSLWSLAALAAVGTETVLRLYALEREAMPSRRSGGVVLALRLAMLALLALMLLQPVLVRKVRRWLERRVVVLVDDSDSMRFRDPEWAVSEKLDLAGLYGVKGVEKRPSTASATRDLMKLANTIDGELALLQLPAGATPQSAAAVIDARKKALSELPDAASKAISESASELKRFAQSARPGTETVASLLRAVEAMEKASPQAASIGKLADSPGDPLAALNTIRKTLADLNDAARGTLRSAPPAARTMDQEFYDSLDQAAKDGVSAACARTRAEIARDALLADRSSEPSPLRKLTGKYHVQVLRFAAGVREEATGPLLGEPPESRGAGTAADAKQLSSGAESRVTPAQATNDLSFGAMTDMAGALEEVLSTVPSDILAGALIISDGRHNAESRVEAVARRFGAQRAPVCTVTVGAEAPPRDAAILNLRAPESIYAGDRVAVRADMKFDALKGRKANVTLFCEGTVVHREQLDIPDVEFRTTVRFAHTPADMGIHHYRLVIESLEGEILEANNHTTFDVAVSDDRTNVLLIDWQPRWEFRYLRNLFYGRDKSVHLQYVLLKPDTMAGADPLPTVRASAGRKFGDAEATALPESREEWMKFDAIILGDIPPDAIDEDDWKNIEACVADRGALLTLISGPCFMPHGYGSPLLQRMLPVTYERSDEPLLKPPEESYRLRLTPDGRAHVIMQQSPSASENIQVWDAIPPLGWRHGGLQVKPASTILAYAEPEPDGGSGAPEGASARDAAQELERKMTLRQKNPLVVFQTYGSGRVLFLGFDRTWRFRYRVGDTYHHRFWGQVMRWGTGENLRAGTSFVRLGTDAITYTPRDQVAVLAKLVTPDYKPVRDADVFVNILRDGKAVARKRLQYREMSNGIYEAKLDPLPATGRYRIELDSPQASRILAEENAAGVETEINVSNARSPAELSELTADRQLMAKIAALSGGATVGPPGISEVCDRFGPGSRLEIEKKEDTLWDKWPLLAAILACATAEWLLRRKAGLP